MKNLVLFIAIALFLAACGNSKQQENAEKAETTAEKTEKTNVDKPKENAVEVVELDKLINETDKFVGKKIKVTGTVNHVCQHGGKKLFIMGTDPEKRFKIDAGENISEFDVTLEGSDIEVEGEVKELRIDEAYLAQLKEEASKEPETEDKKDSDTNKEGEHEHEHEHEPDHIDEDNNTKENIESLRKQLEESGKDHISFYSIDCNQFKKINE